MMKIKQFQVESTSGKHHFLGSPDYCPHCHVALRPNPIYACGYSLGWGILMNCPREACDELFIAYYNNSVNSFGNFTTYGTYDGRTSTGRLIGKGFAGEILQISPNFDKIYNEAFIAEQHGLLEICGVGYRKALEFLIKDYIISKHPDQKEKVEKKLLGPCINDYVTDDKVKSVAKRAVWLGNDETHYIRKWEGKNLADMKKLIDLTLHWIEAEILTESFVDEMPD